MTHQLIYTSVASTPMQLEALDDILEQAQVNNERQAITGALVYMDGYFLQVIEGEQASVERLMQKISRDVRHGAVAVLQAGEVPDAAFAGWKMAYVSATPAQVAAWVGLSITAQGPEVWEDVRQDRNKVALVTKGILSMLVGGDVPPGAR